MIGWLLLLLLLLLLFLLHMVAEATWDTLHKGVCAVNAAQAGLRP